MQEAQVGLPEYADCALWLGRIGGWNTQQQISEVAEGERKGGGVIVQNVENQQHMNSECIRIHLLRPHPPTINPHTHPRLEVE